MAHHQNCARIIRDHLFQKIQRLQIQIVGRLVQNQQVRRRGQHLRQQQPRAFATGQHLHRRTRLRRREEKIFQIARHMARLAADEHSVAAAAGQYGADHGFRLQGHAVLVQRRHHHIGPDLHIARVGLQFADEHVEQGRLARAVRADDTHAIAAMDTHGEIADDQSFAEGFGNPFRVDHPRAATFGFADGKVHLPRDAQLFAAALSQRAQIGHALDIALAPPAHAIAHPVFFHRDLAVELVAFDLFLLEHRVAPVFEMRETLFESPRLAAIQPHRRARQVFEKAPVMADEHQRAALRLQFALQPLDGGKIEMVGGFVQQKNIRLRRQGARQRRAPRFAAGQMRRVLVAREAQLAEQIVGAVGVVTFAQSCLDIVARGGEARKVRFLRQVTDHRARLREARAVVRLDQAGGDLEQGGFARTVAAHKAQPLARAHGQLRAIQQLRVAEAKLDVLQGQKRGGHRGRFLWHPSRAGNPLRYCARFRRACGSSDAPKVPDRR